MDKLNALITEYNNKEPKSTKTYEILYTNCPEAVESDISIQELINIYRIRYENQTNFLTNKLSDQALEFYNTNLNTITNENLTKFLRDNLFFKIILQFCTNKINPNEILEIISTKKRQYNTNENLELLITLRQSLKTPQTYININDYIKYIYKKIKNNSTEDPNHPDLIAIKTSLKEHISNNELLNQICSDPEIVDCFYNIIEKKIKIDILIDKILDYNNKEEFYTPEERLYDDNNLLKFITPTNVNLPFEPKQLNLNDNPMSIENENNFPFQHYSNQTRNTNFYSANDETIPLTSNIDNRSIRFTLPRASSTNQPPTNQYPSLNTGREESILSYVKPFTIKDASKIIPEFDGNKNKLHEFIEGCISAKQMIPHNLESELVKVIPLRLKGIAKQYLKDKSFFRIVDIIDYCEKLFGENKSFYELCGKLSDIKQRSDETVLEFSIRLQTASKAIKRAAERENKITNRLDTSLQKDLKKFFRLGLRQDIKMNLNATPEDPLEDIVMEALEIEKEIGLPIKINKIDSQNLNCQLCGKIGHTTKFCNNIKTDNKQQIKTKDTCQLCNKLGHLANTCRSLPFLKQTNNQPQINCQLCKKPGHSAQNCHYLKNWKKESPPTLTFSQSKQITSCNYCKKIGHTIEECRRRMYNNEKRDRENRFQGNDCRPSQLGAVKKVLQNLGQE